MWKFSSGLLAVPTEARMLGTDAETARSQPHSGLPGRSAQGHLSVLGAQTPAGPHEEQPTSESGPVSAAGAQYPFQGMTGSGRLSAVLCA